jgi:FkbM family methyltransferase
MRRLEKLVRILTNRSHLKALYNFGIAAAVEHTPTLQRLPFDFILDIGANVGQFALAARSAKPLVPIISFEPQPEPAGRFRRLFSGDSATTLFEVEIGNRVEIVDMHVSARNDSSSLLPITRLQTDIFRGTDSVGVIKVNVAPLSNFVSTVLGCAGLMKIDVQGYELEVLRGSMDVLPTIRWVYIEASFVELYGGQSLAGSIIDFLQPHGFYLSSIAHPFCDGNGNMVQGDFLFSRIDSS